MARVISTEKAEHGQLPHFPRSCAVTGRDSGEFVDFQVMIDHPQGVRLYVCREVIEEIAREEFGMVSGGKAKQLEEWFENAKRERDDLQATLDAAAKLEERRPNAVRRKELSHA